MAGLNAIERSWGGDPWSQLERMQAEMDRWVPSRQRFLRAGDAASGRLGQRRRGRRRGGAPGFEPNDVDISVENDVLTLQRKARHSRAQRGHAVVPAGARLR